MASHFQWHVARLLVHSNEACTYENYLVKHVYVVILYTSDFGHNNVLRESLGRIQFVFWALLQEWRGGKKKKKKNWKFTSSPTL